MENEPGWCRQEEVLELEGQAGGIQPDNIPARMKAVRQWVCWRYKRIGGELKKPPYQPLNGAKAYSNHPDTWGWFEDAIETVARGLARGIGFMFTEDSGIVGIDLDHCRNARTGAIQPRAESLIRIIDSYGEISPSGEGIHVLAKGTLPQQGKRRGWIEMYSSGRYFTVTGQRVEGTPPTIQDRAVELAELYELLFPDSAPSPTTRVDGSDRVRDEVMVRRARVGKNGARFDRLFHHGDTSDYDGDHSRADLALCRFLYVAGASYDQIDRLFRQSGLYRDKWEREDYRRRTINTSMK